MFGKKRKRSKLKESLLNEAKRIEYTKQFNDYIRKLENLLPKYQQMALEGKEESSEEKMQIGIKYTKFIENNLNKMKHLKARLEAVEINVDSQNAFNGFVEALEDYTGVMKEQTPKKRSVKKSLKDHKRKSNHLNNHLAFIDKRITKIDKTTLDHPDTKVKLSKKEINTFFDENERK